MFAGEESMFGHVGDQLNGLESRMANFELDSAHNHGRLDSLPADPGHMMNGGILAVGDGSNGSLGGGMHVTETLSSGGVGGGSAQSSASVGAGAANEMAIKVLVSNKDAGSLIGKNGSTIVSFQAATGSRVRVSRADEPFPGTQERVVLITGTLECVSRCLALVIEQVHKHFSDYPYADKEVQSLDPNAHRTMNLVIPAGASGLIIGRGGDTVRTLASKSGSHIQLAGRERQIQGLSERLLCLTGSLASNVAAASFILQILHDDPSGKYDNVSTSYRGFATPPSMAAHVHQPVSLSQPIAGAHPRTAPATRILPQRHALRGRRDNAILPPGGVLYSGSYPGYAPADVVPIFPSSDYSGGGLLSQGNAAPDAFHLNGNASLLQHLPHPAHTPSAGPADARATATQMTMQVPDAVVPIILGKGGAIMREIQQRSGARIRVSQKGEYVPGTNDRLVTISAPSHHQAHGAYLMVAQKIGIA